MALTDLPLPPDGPPPPPEVRRFLREAGRRVERFCRDSPVPAFVPGDFTVAYAALRSLAESGLLAGNWFCEWGSGFGVVTCLAAMLGFEARGLEVDGGLVEAARRLADDFGLPSEFVCGSFLPAGADAFVAAAGGTAWLDADAPAGYEELGLDPDDFDVVFAYPWPDEERLTAALFDRYARGGAVLVTYHEVGGLRLRRRAGRRRPAG